ncbi:hypothetical protein GTW45_21900 [Streptomyces sp. SID4940]|nr:hypothetical protein [Streptomyces sp. SID4940]
MLGGARDTGESLVREALEEAGRVRGEADAEMAETRRRTAGVLAHQEREHAERGKAADEELAAAEAVVAAREAELAERGEALLARARRELSEAEEAARHRQEDAEAQAAGLLSEARVAEERVGRETDRVLREHEEAREEVRSHMAHVRTALASLTGRTLPDREPAEG